MERVLITGNFGRSLDIGRAVDILTYPYFLP